MKRLRLCFLLSLSIFCCQMTAQVDDLMRDKNITWIAESYNDFLTDESAAEKIGKRISGARLLKYYNPTEGGMPEEFVLQNFILELAKEGKLPIYKDDKCTQQTTYDIASGSVDTYDLKDAMTYETITCTMGKGWISYEDILFFRAHQIVFYDSSKVQFGLRTLGIALMKKISNERGEIINWKPLFWIKVSDLMQKRNLSDESITWAKRMTLIEGISLKADRVKILKEFGDNEPTMSLFNALKTKFKIPFYGSYDASIKTEFTIPERDVFFTEKDSSKYDNSEIDTHYHTPTSGIKANHIKELRILENWYWDDKKKQLEIWLSAVGPLIDIKNEAGEFLFRYPLFYRRTDD